jgi:diguanylate cyclase (GGDEF)-like protein
MVALTHQNDPDVRQFSAPVAVARERDVLSDPSPSDPLLAIWEKHRAEMLGRVDLIERAVAALLAGELHESLRADAHAAAHTLVGSAGTFGFAQAAQSARELELGLSAPRHAQVPRLAELILALRRQLAQNAALPPSKETVEPHAPQMRLLLVDDDRELCERIAAEAASLGIHCDTAGSPAEARAICAERAPTVVLLDLTFPPEGMAQAYELLSELTSRAPPIPVLVLTGSDAFTDRVEAARRGGRAFLPKSLAPAEVLDAAMQFSARGRLAATRVLLVDDDPAVLEAMRVLLQAHDIEVSLLSEPLRFWETLQEFSPELLILDVDMPGVNGPELCRVVRNDPRWSNLAVIFVTAHTDPETVQGVFQAGADDYLPKPIVEADLLTRVTNRLERIRSQRLQAERDDLTGLANRAKATEGLTQLLSLARRFSQPVSIALLDLDHFKLVNDTRGHAAGDTVLRGVGEHLRRDFRGDDVVGRWGGEEFIVGMYGMRREDGVRRMHDTLDRFRTQMFTSANGNFRVSFSAGVAEYPSDGTDLGGLTEAADTALYHAKAAGRAHVLAAAVQVSAERCDVVCVEDDDALGELLLSTLQTHGYTARRLADGAQAREALSSAQPTLRCKVLLLDVDLPGLDGHSLLRQLAEHGVLSSTRVIMLTARASEPETIKALELGAFDHVAKPFSLPVLMHRVQKAMAARP